MVMMKAQTCCSFWILLTAVALAGAAGRGRWKGSLRTRPYYAPHPANGAGRFPAAASHPHIFPGERPEGHFPQPPDSFLPGPADGFPPLPGGHPPDSRERFPALQYGYPPNRPYDDFPPLPDSHPPRQSHRLPPLPDGSSPQWLDRLPPFQDSLDQPDSYPPQQPVSLPFLPDTSVHHGSHLPFRAPPVSEGEDSFSRSSLPPHDDRQAVFPKLVLPVKREQRETHGSDQGEIRAPRADQIEALVRRTLRREGRKQSRIRDLRRRGYPRKVQWHDRTCACANNASRSREANQPQEPANRTKTAKSGEKASSSKTVHLGKSAPGDKESDRSAESSRQGEVDQGNLFNSSKPHREPLSDVQHRNSARKMKSDSNARKKASFSDDPHPFLDRKTAISFLSRRPAPSKWRQWLKELAVMEQKAGDQSGDTVSHHNHHNHDGEDSSLQRMSSGPQAPAESGDLKDIAGDKSPGDNKEGEGDHSEDIAVDKLNTNQKMKHGLNKHLNHQKMNRKMSALRNPLVQRWLHRRHKQRWRRQQRRRQQRRHHYNNRRQKPRGPKKLLPKLPPGRDHPPKDVLSNSRWFIPQGQDSPNKNKPCTQCPLPSSMHRQHPRRFASGRKIHHRRRFWPSRRRTWRKRGGQKKAKFFRRRHLRHRHKGKVPPFSKTRSDVDRKKPALKSNHDNTSSVTVVSNISEENSSTSPSTTLSGLSVPGPQSTKSPELLVHKTAALKTDELSDSSTPAKETKLPPRKSASDSDGSSGTTILPEEDRGEREGKGGVVAVRTVYLGKVEGPQIETARLDVYRNDSSASADPAPVFVRVQYARENHGDSADSALGRKKRNAVQNNNADNNNNSVEDDDDDNMRIQRRNRRRRMRRRRQQRRRNRMNRRRRLHNDDSDDNTNDLSSSYQSRQQERRRGGYQRHQTGGISADINVDDDDDEQIRLRYGHRQRRPTNIEVSTDDSDSDDEDNRENNNRVVGFVQLRSRSRNGRWSGGTNRRRQHIHRNRRRRQRRPNKRRGRRNRRPRQPRREQSGARFTSGGDDVGSNDNRGAGDRPRESEREALLGQIQTVGDSDNNVQGQEEAVAYIPSPFINHRTAYDFLSTQGRSRSRGRLIGGDNEQQSEQWQFNHRMSESMCEVFNKHFVPTSIGGRCV